LALDVEAISATLKPVMMSDIAPQIVVALEKVITGGSANSSAPPVGIYRSGPVIAEFFRRNGHHDTYSYGSGTWSRVPHTQEMLEAIRQREDGRARILKLVEDSVNPADYVGHEAALQTAVSFLNGYLEVEDLELRWDGRRHRLVDLSGTTRAVTEAMRLVDQLDFDACRREFERAHASLKDDPAAAITAASSTLESIAKTMLARLGEPPPTDQSVGPLMHALLRRLQLLPDGQDDQDIRRLLGGLTNVTAAVGALRTKLGSAHGRGDDHPQPDRALAELCINSAAAVALFVLARHGELSRLTAGGIA